MSLISPDQAKAHLRLSDGEFDPADLALKTAAAESDAIAYLNRHVYADQEALDAAIAAAPAALATASAAYSSAMTAAEAIEDDAERAIVTCGAKEAYTAAQLSILRTYRGMVVNDSIRAAMLLTLGHLFRNRENTVTGVTVESLPHGVCHLLRPFRVVPGA